MIRRLLPAAAMLPLLMVMPGCILTTAQEPIGDMTVADARNIIYTVKSGYAATEILATQYIRLPACEMPMPATLCSSASVVRQMIKARDAARTGINSGEEVVLNATASTPTLVAAVNAAKAAYAAFKTITEANKKS